MRLKWLELFIDHEKVFVDGESIGVIYSHLFMRRHSFVVKASDITAINAIQMPFFVMMLFLFTDDGHRRAVSEDMEGWSDVLDFVKSHFPDFDWEAYEKARHAAELEVKCWLRCGQDLQSGPNVQSR